MKYILCTPESPTTNKPVSRLLLMSRCECFNIKSDIFMFVLTPSQPGVCSNKLTTEINACQKRKKPPEPTCRPAPNPRFSAKL